MNNTLPAFACVPRVNGFIASGILNFRQDAVLVLTRKMRARAGVNKNKLTKEKFIWQDDYFAVSVSESQIRQVINYIKNQEEHHSKKSFADEVDEFMTKYGWSNLKEMNFD